MSARIVVAAPRGLIMSYDKDMLEEFGGHVWLNRHWAHSMMSRMSFVKRRGSTAKSKHSITDFAELKQLFLNDVVTTVTMEDIPPELIMNWDRQGSNWSHQPIGPWSRKAEIGWKLLGSTISAK